MVPIDPDAPWGWNLAVLILILAVVPALTSWVATRGTKAKLSAIEHEVRPNSGTSLADAINRTEAAQLVMTEQVAGLREDVGGIHSEIRDVRRDVAGIRTDARQDRRELAQVRQEVVDVARSLDEHIQTRSTHSRES